MTIAHQIATPAPPRRTRRANAPLRPAAAPRPFFALASIFALITVTAMGAAFVVGTAAIVIMMIASNLGG